MKWKKYAIATVASAEDVVVAVLNELDITAIEIADYMPVPEADVNEGGHYEELQPDLPDSDEAKVIFYLDEDADDSALLQRLETSLAELRKTSDIGPGTISISVTDEADWRDRWKEYFHAFRIGNILIRPSWETDEAAARNARDLSGRTVRNGKSTGASAVVSDGKNSGAPAVVSDGKNSGAPSGASDGKNTDVPSGVLDGKKAGRQITIVVDPGISFGTGQHETTRMCIEALGENVTGESDVLDIGCGSGILSVAALKLGARSVAGTDIDEACMESVRRNFDMNGLPVGDLDFYVGDLTKDERLQERVGEGRYDVVVANILADIIIGMLPQMKRAMKADGVLILSGIIDFKEGQVRNALAGEGFTFVDVRHDGEWVCIVARQGDSDGSLFG